jgi:hypothetical protein
MFVVKRITGLGRTSVISISLIGLPYNAGTALIAR